MSSLRCVKCNRMLAKDFSGYINIKCPRCGYVQRAQKNNK